MLEVKLHEIFDSIIKTNFEMHYDGTVVDDEDPDKLGRLRVRIPELYGNIPVEHIPWATPSLTFGGGGDGDGNYGSFWIPPKKSKVHIRLRRGHPWFPEWYGVHWFKGEPPEESQILPPRNHVFKTPKQHLIDLHDDVEYIRIKDFKGNFIIINTKENTIDVKSNGDMNFEARGDISFRAGGTFHLKAGATINEDAGQIHLNSGRARPKSPKDVDHNS